jgi:hypothetical protein
VSTEVAETIEREKDISEFSSIQIERAKDII